MNAFCDWLANHELAALSLLIALTFAGIVGICKWIARSGLRDEDEHGKYLGL